MLNEAFLQRLDALKIAMRTPAQGGSGGLRRSRALGSSVEFSDFREYAPGDDLRRVDWNAYARFERLFLKLFMEEQETRVNILVDASASMAFGVPSKWEMALNLAQTMCYLALRGGDRVTLYTLGEGMRHSPMLSGRSGFMQGAAFLEGIKPGGKSLISDQVSRLTLPAGRGVSILISDLMSEDGYEKALSSLQYHKQETSVMHVFSPWEMNPELEGASQLWDLETNDKLELIVSGDVLRDYQRELDGFMQGLHAFCLRRGMMLCRLLSDMDFESTVMRALSSAGLIG